MNHLTHELNLIITLLAKVVNQIQFLHCIGSEFVRKTQFLDLQKAIHQNGASTMAVGYSFLNLPLLTQMGFASFLESHLFRVVMQEEQEDFQRKEGRKEEGV
ncbi:hypothetical protein Golob_025678, partial [Gossypium lobatum]|nr:hypothetical protein [Gossypium lobatum]